MHIARTRPALSRGLWADRLPRPPPTPSLPSPRVPPGDDAPLPDLAGNHRHAQGRIRAERRGPRLSLSLVITSKRINLTVPRFTRASRDADGTAAAPARDAASPVCSYIM